MKQAVLLLLLLITAAEASACTWLVQVFNNQSRELQTFKPIANREIVFRVKSFKGTCQISRIDTYTPKSGPESCQEVYVECLPNYSKEVARSQRYACRVSGSTCPEPTVAATMQMGIWPDRPHDDDLSMPPDLVAINLYCR